MGTKMVVAFANIFMAETENEILRQFYYVLFHFVQKNVNYLPLKYPQNRHNRWWVDRMQILGNKQSIPTKYIQSTLSLNGHLFKTDTSIRRTPP